MKYSGPKRMFLGTIDDSVTRYPWEGVSTDLQAFNRSLIFYALLGPSLCCRVGNIVYNPVYFNALVNPDSSPLLELAKSGFLQLQMKNRTINSSIRDRKTIGTNTTLEFIKKYDWKKGSPIYRKLAEINDLLQTGRGKIQYKSDFNIYFQDIVDQVASGDPADMPAEYWKVFEAWSRKFPRDSMERTRSNFEITALQLFKKDPLSVHIAMSAVNSINHYAYGVGLSKKFGDVSIETSELNCLQGLTTTMLGQEERKVSAQRYSELVRSGVLTEIEKNLKVPSRLVTDHDAWKVLAELIDFESSSSVSYAFKACKKRLIENIESVESSEDLEATRKEIGECAKELSAIVRSEIAVGAGSSESPKYRLFVSVIARDAAKKYIGNRANELIDLSATVAGVAATPVVGAAMKFTISLVAQYGIDDQVDRLMNRDVSQASFLNDGSKDANDLLRISKPLKGIICMRQMDRSAVDGFANTLLGDRK